MYPNADCIISWRGVEVPHFPQYPGCVYLLHFLQPLGSDHPRGKAQHYLGSTCHLEKRLAQHRHEESGAKIMQAVRRAGIDFTVVRLWQVSSWDEQKTLEIALKRRHENNRLCPICRGLPSDPLALLYNGHYPFHLFAQPGRRQPMGITRLGPVR